MEITMDIMKSIMGYEEHLCSNCGDVVTTGPTDEFGGLCSTCRREAREKAEFNRQFEEWQGDSDGTAGVD